MRPSVSQRLSTASAQWSCRVFGPTTVHLRHELCLLISLSIVTASSFQAVYRYAFGTQGDFAFWLLSTAWLSRHLFVRWVCTRDTTTTRSPTLLGLMAHWITSHVMAGQWFDRPESMVVVRSVGNVHGGDETRISAFSTPSFSSLFYGVQLVLVRLIYPVQKWREDAASRNSKSSRRSTDNAPESSSSWMHSHGAHSSSRRDHGRVSGSSFSSVSSIWMQKWVKMWTIKGPPLQVCLVMMVASWFLWHLLFYDSRGSNNSHALTMNGRITSADNSGFDDIAGQDSLLLRSRGAAFGSSFARHEAPSWARVFFFLSCGSTLASILVFGRIILPIPDLVAGVCPINAVRAEARLHGNLTSSGGKSSKAKLQKETQDASWAEQYMPITLENRFRLFCTVGLIRVFENVVVCAIIPRTSFTCRATGHCPPGPVLWELSTILYPSGITSSLRPDGSFQGVFGSILPDLGSAIITVFSAIAITVQLLLAQETVLDRSYLAIMGYISGEWVVVDHPFNPSSDRKSNVGSNQSIPTLWDPRRRYKKGDLILQSYPGFGGQSVYKATSNSPEGRPFDLYLRATHDLFRKELGQPGTSLIISFASKVHLVLIALILGMIGWYEWKDYNSVALTMNLVANVIAYVGMVNVGLMDYNKVQTLGKETSARVQSEPGN